jgi:galactonate dehydratase
MSPDCVAEISVSVVEVTPKTRWIFVEIETKAGARGVGEATLGGSEDAVLHAVAGFTPALFAMRDASPSELPRTDTRNLPRAAAFSAFDQALWDIAAQRRGIRLAEALGSVRRAQIPVYANVNRRTLDRSPAGFAASARGAIAAGHDAVKIAPFDEATVDARAHAALRCAVEPGLERIAAVRDAIGPTRRLMVDCHWRLDEAVAEHVIRVAASLGVHWVECPLPETQERIPALVRLRRLANSHGVLLAGCELEIGLSGFAPFIDAGAYDVMMPDAKYVGGLAKMLCLAQRMRDAGVAFSPHNPSGPVCHAASLHVSAAAEGLHSLETQFDETPLFDALAGAPFRPVEGGATTLPTAVGIGMRLQPRAVAGCQTARWVATQERPHLVCIQGRDQAEAVRT